MTKKYKGNNMANTLQNKECLISYNLTTNCFVLSKRLFNDRFCIGKGTTRAGQEAIKDFVLHKATKIVIQRGNGKVEHYPITCFQFNTQDGYLEHEKEKIAINLFQPIEQSYNYQYDIRGEIVEREPFDNVTIL